MGIFGWSYPPGAAGDPTAPYNQEYYCEVCGQHEDKCVCPECKECGTVGDPNCYKHHGMELNEEQILAKEKAQDKINDELARDNARYDLEKEQ